MCLKICTSESHSIALAIISLICLKLVRLTRRPFRVVSDAFLPRFLDVVAALPLEKEKALEFPKLSGPEVSQTS